MTHSFKSDDLQKIVMAAVSHFVKCPVDSFPPAKEFMGGGVYALYYLGDSPLYVELKLMEVKPDSIPIYVGKANPSGWRTARISATGKKRLYNRIREHYRNVVAAENLDPKDFKVKYMVLDGDEGGLIGPVEAALIQKFKPLWNNVIDGFGNHTPGERRFNQAKSGWDVLHPGREWAKKCKGPAPAYDNLIAKIKSYTEKIKKK